MASLKSFYCKENCIFFLSNILFSVMTWASMFAIISWLLPSLSPSPGSSSFDAKTRVPRCPIHFRGHVRRWRCRLATARAGTRSGPTPRRGRSSTRTPGSVLTQVMDNPWRFSTWLLARIFRPKCGILITMQTKVSAI